MRGRFSIEWMAQSSQSAEAGGPPGSNATGLSTSGTHSENLPGFYCRQRPGPGLCQEAPQPSPPPRERVLFKQEESSRVSQTETGFSSSTEEETSGYESEGGRSLSSPSAPPTHGGSELPPSPPSGRRPRTAFTAEQVGSLERAFKKNAYLGTQDKSELCRKLRLSDKQIRNWFQNRRMKLKRTVQDALAQACQANMASQFLHYPELSGYRSTPYARYTPGQEGQTATAHHLHPSPLQYGSTSALQPSVSALPSMDSFFQYSSLPGLVLPSAPGHLMAAYPPYTQHY